MDSPNSNFRPPHHSILSTMSNTLLHDHSQSQSQRLNSHQLHHTDIPNHEHDVGRDQHHRGAMTILSDSSSTSSPIRSRKNYSHSPRIPSPNNLLSRFRSASLSREKEKGKSRAENSTVYYDSQEFTPATPPLELEEKFPERIHELLRQKSDAPEATASETDLDITVMKKNDARNDKIEIAGTLGLGLEDMTKTKPKSLTEGGAPLVKLPTLTQLPSRSSVKTREIAEKINQRLKKVKFHQTDERERARLDLEVEKSAHLAPPLTFSGRVKRRVVTPVGRSKFAVSGDQPPAAPKEVLAREEGSEAFATIGEFSSRQMNMKGYGQKDKRKTLRWDRMLVKVEWTIKSLRPGYDEKAALGIEKDTEPWEEFAVVWRHGQLELWCDYKIPLRESVQGHKRLKHIIPLVKGKTQLSLYSFTDRIFCLYFEPDEMFSRTLGKAQKRAFFHFRHEGTNIFLFRARAPSIGSDWLWNLYLELGGRIPETLELTLPNLDITIRHPIPDLVRSEGLVDGDTVGERCGVLLKDFTVRNLIEESTRLLEGYSEFSSLVREGKSNGVVIALAWRKGQLLEWISEETDVEGKEKYNAVLEAAAFSASERSKDLEQKLTLELRAAQHYPTYIHLSLTKRVMEPSPIEGYVSRIRPKTDTKERLYLTTYDSHLFIIPRQSAWPPNPPAQGSIDRGMSALTVPVSDLNKYSMERPVSKRKRVRNVLLSLVSLGYVQPQIPKIEEPADETPIERFRRKEQERAVHHIMRSHSYLNLRDIVVVARFRPELFHKTRDELIKLTADDCDPTTPTADATPEELRIRRSFVVIMSRGALYRFEAMDEEVAGEWISRLNELATYWKRRLQQDAMNQMEITPSAHEALSCIRKRPYDDEVNLDENFKFGGPLLGTIYNWCVLNSCRTIIKSGRLYIRAGVNNLFNERYMMLVDGHLLQFSLPPDTSKLGSLEGQYFRKSVTSLKDCYVYTGRMINIRYRSNSQFNPANLRSDNFPRIYPDGLLSTDAEDECSFVIFRKISNDGKGLGKRGTTRVMRARSKVERDDWVFALNSELEKLVRKDRAHEEGMKDFKRVTSCS